MDYESTAECIRSCITSVKGGLPIHLLEADFRKQIGEALRPEKFGYSSLRDLLISIKEIHLEGNILKVKDPRTEHISKLIDKQKGPAKFKTAKRPVPSRFTDWRVGANNMKRTAPRLLREREKKLESLKESKLLPDPPSAMTTRNLQTFNSLEETIQSKFQRESHSPFGGSSSSLGTGSFGTYDEARPGGGPGGGPGAGRGAIGRGRGRGWSSHNSNETPGGLSGRTTPRRETVSPDVRSLASDSMSKGGCGAFSSSSLSETSDEREPVIFKFQLIGEHFLTKVATLILGVKVEPSETRLCCSSLDIASCLKRLKRCSALSDRVILMLGLTDIMKGKDLDAIKPMMVELLEYLQSQTKQIVVVTIPVPPCLKKMPKPLKTLLSYNEWLLTLKFPGTRVVDILPYTQNKEKETYEFLCDSKAINAWNETACWTFVEALFFSGLCV